jgi:hypothetical protein
MTETSRWAVLSGLAGLAANVLLILFFALERPWADGGAGIAWLGPANDAAVAVQFAALVPVALAVHAMLAGRLGRGVTAAGVTAMVLIVVLQLALLADLLTFDVQVWAVIACLVAAFGWVLLAGQAGRDVLPRPAVRLGTFAGAGYLAGVAIAGLGMALPAGSFGQYASWTVGGLLGAAAWLALPAWPLALVPAGRVPAGRVAVAR